MRVVVDSELIYMVMWFIVIRYSLLDSYWGYVKGLMQ